jgi:hypothetical protein
LCRRVSFQIKFFIFVQFSFLFDLLPAPKFHLFVFQIFPLEFPFIQRIPTRHFWICHARA